jgi:hypothetical protein
MSVIKRLNDVAANASIYFHTLSEEISKVMFERLTYYYFTTIKDVILLILKLNND